MDVLYATVASMPPKYRRLIFGLLVFLGLMLLIGRFRIDTTREMPPPAVATAPEPAAAALTGRRDAPAGNPYTDISCNGAREALASLRSSRDTIVGDAGFSNATDPYSLSSMLQRADELRAQSLPPCLERARGQLLSAASRAESTLLEHLDTDTDAFTLHTRMQEAMKSALDNADKEFALVEAAVQQKEAALVQKEGAR